MKRTKMPAPRRAGTENEKRARLVRLMLEIASLDRDEYRTLRTEIWNSVALAHPCKPAAGLNEWLRRAS